MYRNMYIQNWVGTMTSRTWVEMYAITKTRGTGAIGGIGITDYQRVQQMVSLQNNHGTSFRGAEEFQLTRKKEEGLH